MVSRVSTERIPGQRGRRWARNSLAFAAPGPGVPGDLVCLCCELRANSFPSFENNTRNKSHRSIFYPNTLNAQRVSGASVSSATLGTVVTKIHVPRPRASGQKPGCTSRRPGDLLPSPPGVPRSPGAARATPRGRGGRGALWAPVRTASELLGPGGVAGCSVPRDCGDVQGTSRLDRSVTAVRLPGTGPGPDRRGEALGSVSGRVGPRVS